MNLNKYQNGTKVQNGINGYGIWVIPKMGQIPKTKLNPKIKLLIHNRTMNHNETLVPKWENKK